MAHRVRAKRERRAPWWHSLSPAQLLAGSFLLAIAVGTVGLRAVPAFYTAGVPLGWVDALFTATSAVCVTGLIVVDTATHFTLAGQAFLLVLIQAGGLGMITITTLVILSLGGRLSLRAETVVANVPRGLPDVATGRLVRDVVLFTAVFEAMGAAALFVGFLPSQPLPSAIWHAVFHSVSAFCNAGFSTFTDSLVGYTGDPVVLWTLMGLIVLGGIGFLTLEELAVRHRARGTERAFRLSLHSRVVLATTFALLVGAWILYAAFEWRGVLAGMSPADRIQNALFMSVTARTAGFNTVSYADASDPSNFLTILLMSIGGSPGSTAGGIKTTTFFLVGLLAWSRLEGRAAVSAWTRTVPNDTVHRAVGVFVVSFVAVTAAIFLLTVLEAGNSPGDPFLSMMFEVVSAFNTVGLSLGTTATLEPGSRMLIAVLMFAGRVGPLSLAAALAMRAHERAHQYRYATEDVLIG